MAGRIPFFYPSYSNSAVPRSNGQIPPPPPPPPPPTLQGQPGSQYNNGINAGYGYGYPTVPFYNYPGRTTPWHATPPQQTTQPRPQPIPEPPKANSNPQPAAPEWYCDACDLALHSEKALKSHRKSHVKCTECSFEGAPKVVKAHCEGSHGRFSGSGFKTVTVAIPGCPVRRFKICVGNRPEDIQRWIEERKRRFPRQQQHQQQQQQQLIKTQDDSKNPNLATSESPTQPSTAMNSLLAGYGSSDSDDENSKDNHEPQKPMTSVQPTSPENPPDKVDNPIALPANTEKPSHSNKRPCRFFMRNGICRNGDACNFSHEVQSVPVKHSNNNNNSNASKTSPRKRKRGGHCTSDTLLRKLLSNDMERESAVTMQLLKFIVEKDFFLGVKSTGKDHGSTFS